MQYMFKQAVHLQKKNYFKGLNEVPESVEADPYFLKMVKAGLIVEADSKKQVSQETLQERNDRLYDKLIGKSRTKGAEGVAPQPDHAPKKDAGKKMKG